jgi:hypothetical protein
LKDTHHLASPQVGKSLTWGDTCIWMLIDLLVAATAVHHGLSVLHVDNDFVTIASGLSELRQKVPEEFAAVRC